jgi:hypothetical protein
MKAKVIVYALPALILATILITKISIIQDWR